MAFQIFSVRAVLIDPDYHAAGASQMECSFTMLIHRQSGHATYYFDASNAGLCPRPSLRTTQPPLDASDSLGNYAVSICFRRQFFVGGLDLVLPVQHVSAALSTILDPDIDIKTLRHP